MNRRSLYGISALLGIGLLALWWAMRHHDKKVDQSIATTSLGPDDRTKTVLDNAHHTVTRIDDKGSHKTFLNSHGPVSIIEKKDGSTVLIQRTWGTELSPFAGGTVGSDFKFRVAVGANGFYVQRWELGGGLLLNPSEIKDLRLFGHVAYNVYGNWLISAGVDNHTAIHLIASVRF
jgi:hypothetical protein